MKNYILRSTRQVLKFTMILILFISFSNGIFAQSNMTPISAEQAATEVAQQQANYGFSQVYLDANDLSRLISSEDISGVRFYTAQTEGLATQTVIAVGIRNDNTEAGFYIRMDDLSGTFLTQSEARGDVQRSKDGQFTSVAITVNKNDLNGIMTTSGATGVHIKPGLSESNNTMIVASAVNSNGFTMDLGSSYFRNEAPCPNNCGGDYLINLN